jgi:hypothetical protein
MYTPVHSPGDKYTDEHLKFPKPITLKITTQGDKVKIETIGSQAPDKQ